MWNPTALRQSGPRYLALADQIADDIAAGELKPGERLPPQRDLADAVGLDFTTVTRAYAEAKRRGLIFGHVGRGTFVRARAGGLGAEGRDEMPVVDLSLNIQPRPEPDVAALALSATLQEFSKRADLGAMLDYSRSSGGMMAHRTAGAQWLSMRGLKVPAESVVVCMGVQHGLALALGTLARPGELVLTEELTYSGFRALADNLRLDVDGLAMDSDGILPEAFERACRLREPRALYCTPTLHNPTAIVTPLVRRKALAEIAVRYKVPIIEDDVYGPLVANAPPTIASIAPALTYFVTSLSKAVAGGLRIGYIVAPDRVSRERLEAGVRATTWMAPPLMAEIVSEWIRSGVASSALAANRAESRRRQAVAAEVLAEFAWHAHSEAFHGWLELPNGWSSAEFVVECRRAGVIVTPGDSFAVASYGSAPAVRLSLSGAATLDLLRSALSRMATLLSGGPESLASVL